MPLQLAAAVTLAIWIYFLLFRGGFWREFRRGAGPPPAPSSTAPRIVAIVPARDEADVVGRAIASLAAQRPPGYFHIILVDDHSTDGTGAIAAAAAPRDLLTVVSAAPLPPGWTGKLWAVAEGVRHAAPLQPDYLLLTDADIVHPQDNAATLAARAESENYDLVSYMATLAYRTPAARAACTSCVHCVALSFRPPASSRSSPCRASAASMLSPPSIR